MGRIYRTITDLEGRLQSVCDEFCALLQLNRGDLVGRDVLELTYRDDRGDTRADMRRLRDEARLFSIIKRYVASDGTIIWANANASFLQGRDTPQISGLIQLVSPDPNLAYQRERNRRVFEAFDAWAPHIL